MFLHSFQVPPKEKSQEMHKMFNGKANIQENGNVCVCVSALDNFSSYQLNYGSCP